MAQIREGFIVDEDEEDEAEDSDERERRRRKKRRRAEREQEEALDEEDLDLIGEANPEFQRREQTQVCFTPGLCGADNRPCKVLLNPRSVSIQAAQARPRR